MLWNRFYFGVVHKVILYAKYFRTQHSINRGLISNLPFVVAPPTAISIFLSVYLRQTNMDFTQGGLAVILSGVLLLGLGYRPLGRLFKRLIPHCIQVQISRDCAIFVVINFWSKFGRFRLQSELVFLWHLLVARTLIW